MSNPWYTIIGPSGWPGVSINTGNKKIDGKYYNILGDKNIQLAASGNMWLVGASGIQLVSQGYVDASGLRVKNLNYQSIQKIDNLGHVVSAYPGSDGAIVFRSGEQDLVGIPDNKLVYNTGLSMLTMPSYSYGPLYVSSGNINSPDSHEIKSFPSIEYVEGLASSDPPIPPSIKIGAITTFTSGIQIFPNYQGYAGSILTHMGVNNPAEWQAASYLNADGVLWNRYPRRPITIENGQIIFYANKPIWSQDWKNTPTLEILKQELGEGYDTIELVRNDTREIVHIKLAAQITYVADEANPDLQTPLEVLFKETTIVDPEGTSSNPVAGFVAKICTPIPWADQTAYSGNGYAYSITKGAYLDMQLGRTAKEKYSCTQSDVANSELKFKPSTLNSISIRPNTHTAFNMLGENIDFIIYGERKTLHENYDASIFDLNENNIPVGLVPAFKVDSNIPNSVSGSPTSGVYFTKYMDRAKLIPSGWSYDTKPKVMINTSGAYAIDSIPTGIEINGVVETKKYITTYADLTVRSTLYSDNIISENLYLRPKPTGDNAGPYIPNALLTIDQSGKIISRIPKSNPTIPGKPSNIMLDPDNNGSGNSESSITWTIPLSDGNSQIINYLIQFSTNGGSTWTDIPNSSNFYINRANAYSNKATIIGLSPLTSYRFRVAAQNYIGIGEYSNASSTIIPGLSVPKAPYGLTQVRTFDTSAYSDIKLSWVAGQNGSSNLLGFSIEESSDNGLTWQYYPSYDPAVSALDQLITNTTETITGTTSKINYYYRISAWNSFGQSAFSYIYSSGNVLPEDDPDAVSQQQTDQLSNWDFGTVLFTGVCSV